MPNWVFNRVTVEGDKDHVFTLQDSGFDFNKLYPCPVEKQKYDEWYSWCCSHWGTKWPASDVELVDYVEGTPNSVLEAHFNTAWSPPHGFLAYMTKVYPELKIYCQFEEEGYQTIGEARYEGGAMEIKQFHPLDYTPTSLEEFAKENTWFDWDSVKSYLNDCGIDMGMMELDNYNEIELTILKMTADEYTENSEKEFTAINVAIKKGHVQVERGV